MYEIIGNTTSTPMKVSDWNQTDETKSDYIKNKPTIPTKISELENDSNFMTEATVPTHSWNGTVLTITSASGTTSADLKGDAFVYEDFTQEQLAKLKGNPGDSGVFVGSTEPTNNSNVWIDPTGNSTEVIEYVLTETDKLEIANKVLEILPIWEGGNY